MAVPAEISDRLLAECLGRPQAYAELGWLCDHVGGRTSGLESGRRAEEWAFDLLTRWGLENVRYEPLPVTAWQRGTLAVQAISPVSWTLAALAHGNAPAEADVTAPIVDAGHGERADFERVQTDVAGKIALCDEGATEGQRALHRSEKLLLAAGFGAAGLMISSLASGALPRTGVCRYGAPSPIPSVGIAQEDGDRLRRLLRAGTLPDVRIAMNNTFVDAETRNVLADIRGGEQPDEIVYAGAHLDSWDVAQGATDNGLGTAIVLEMARALSIVAASGRHPRRTLRFALWAAEEIGLCGSRHHAAQHADTLPRIVALMNFDMTGSPYGFNTPGRNEPTPLLREVSQQLAALGMEETFSSQASLHSDHQPFLLAGVPIVGLLSRRDGEGAHYYHSAGDTFEKISRPGLCRAAAVGAHALWALADAPERVFPSLSPREVRAIIGASDLFEALVAEGYDGPPMQVGADEDAQQGKPRAGRE